MEKWEIEIREEGNWDKLSNWEIGEEDEKAALLLSWF